MECGPTCLRMVAKHYNCSIPLQLLTEKTQIGKEDVNLLGISEAAEVVGFRTKAIKTFIIKARAGQTFSCARKVKAPGTTTRADLSKLKLLNNDKV